MKSKVFCLCVCVSAFFAWSGPALAQNCITYQPDYAVYASESTDGTNIYTSVVLDGSGTMTVNQAYCGGLTFPNAVHTPMALNILTPPAGGGTAVGGMSSGTPECPDCYLSTTNNQQIAATPDTDYTFTYGGEVICSVGERFGASIIISV